MQRGNVIRIIRREELGQYSLSTFLPRPRRIAWIVGAWKYPALDALLLQIPKKADLGIGSSMTPPAFVHFRRIGFFKDS